MDGVTHFGVDSQLVGLLGRSYRSVEQALKELVDNAWDSDAHNIRITVPELMSGNTIVVEDDGTGMTRLEVESEYLRVARDRRKKGNVTVGLKRKVKGQKGIGKFAGFVIANNMEVTTCAGGVKTGVPLSKEQVMDPKQDLNSVGLAVTEEPIDPKQHGTCIVLSNLNPKFELPNIAKLKGLLIREYGREDDLTITVNDERLSLADVPGKPFDSESDVPEVGPMRMRFIVSDTPHPARQAGISVRVGNKIIGSVSHFGLDEDEELPRKLLNHVYGEIEVDGLGPGVTADGGGFTEGYIGFEAIRPLIKDAVKKALNETFPREIGLHKGRLTQEQERRLARMPEHRRHFARIAVERAMKKFYGESADKVETVTNVVLDAIERDDYYEVLRAIDESLASEVARLAEALQEFGIVDMANLGTQAQNRLRLLEHFEALINNPKTVEKQVHEVVESNRWLLGYDYPIISSNQTLASVIAKYVQREFTGKKANKRPDLFLGKHLKGKHLLIEFKRPQHVISRDDQNQAVKYRDDLTHDFGDIEILLLGKRREQGISTQFDSKWLAVMSYQELISNAREQLNWLLDSIRDTKVSIANCL